MGQQPSFSYTILRRLAFLNMLRGKISFSVVTIAALLMVPANVSAQEFLDRNSAALAVSSDGSIIVGVVEAEENTFRAFRWIDDGNGLLDLGSLRHDNLGASIATFISANGTVIVGYADTDDEDRRAFRWIDDGNGMLDLGSLRSDNSGGSTPYAVSANGAVIVGGADTEDDGVFRAFRWIDDNTGMLDLGSLRTDNLGSSLAAALSAEGTVTVGWAENQGGGYRAFRWIDDNTGMLDLGTLRSDNSGDSEALAVSADGAVIVGRAEANDNNRRAFRWIAANTGMLDLGSLRSDNLGFSSPSAMSADGTIIVGYADTDDEDRRAFRWIDDNTGMLDLGSLRTDNSGPSFANAVSADGSVIVGEAEGDDNHFRAFRWIDHGTGMLDLGTLRTDNSGPSFAYAVSADGNIIVGVAQSDNNIMRAFIWRTQMQDLERLTLSFPVLANDTEIVVAQQQHVLGRLLTETCHAEGGRVCLKVGGRLVNIGDTGSQAINSRNNMATLTFGWGLDAQNSIGGTLSVNNSGSSTYGFNKGMGVGASLWGQYSEGGPDGTGLQAGAAFGWASESGTFTRGVGLDNVMRAAGDSSLQTLSARATLGYGFLQKNWLVTPSATLAQFRSSRSAYAETGSDFDANYSTLSMNRTTATLALSSERKVGTQGTLMLDIGVEHDLSADRAVLTGTSTAPGMESVWVDSTLERLNMRRFVNVGYSHDMGDDRSLSGSIDAGKSAFGSGWRVGVNAQYSINF